MQHRTSSPTTSGFWCDQIPQTGTHDNWMPGFPLCSDSSVLRPDGTFGQSSTTCSEKRARRGTLARSAAQGTSSHCGFALCIGVPYTPQFRWRLRSITRMPMRSPQPFCSRASLPTAARFLLSRSWPSGAGSQQRVKASSRYYLAGIAEGSMQLFSSRPFAYGRNGFRISQSRSRRCVSSPRQLAWFLDGKCFLISPTH